MLGLVLLVLNTPGKQKCALKAWPQSAFSLLWSPPEALPNEPVFAESRYSGQCPQWITHSSPRPSRSSSLFDEVTHLQFTLPRPRLKLDLLWTGKRRNHQVHTTLPHFVLLKPPWLSMGEIKTTPGNSGGQATEELRRVWESVLVRFPIAVERYHDHTTLILENI